MALQDPDRLAQCRAADTVLRDQVGLEWQRTADHQLSGDDPPAQIACNDIGDPRLWTVRRACSLMADVGSFRGACRERP